MNDLFSLKWLSMMIDILDNILIIVLAASTDHQV